jgi:hypothetical protein
VAVRGSHSNEKEINQNYDGWIVGRSVDGN